MNEIDKKAFEEWHRENISNSPTLNDLIERAWHDFCDDGNGIGGKRAIEFMRGKNK